MISQSELAKHARVNPNLISRYERNEAIPSIEIASKMADALKISLDYLAGKSDHQIDQTILDFVLTIQELPNEDKEHILYTIEGLIEHAKSRMVYRK